MRNLIAQETPRQANFGTQGIQPPSTVFGNPNTSPTVQLETMISTGIGILTIVAGLFFVFYFFLAAIKWMTAGGDAGQIQKARDEMIQGVMGLVIIVAAYGVIGLIGTIFGIDLLNPAAQINEIVAGLRGFNQWRND